MSARCPACGAGYAADAKFCTRDGTRLVPGVPASALPTAPLAPVSAPPAAGTQVFTPPARPAPAPSNGPAGLVGRVLDGRYRIERKVGEGGMAHVFLARDVGTAERWAIKVLSPALARDQNAMARLRREAGLGSRLAHPNVCHIVRLGETEDGLVYVVMPFVEGELLVDREQRLGVVPLAEAVRVVRDIAAGLHVAHQLRIVHRDLKPENVMISPDGAGGERAVVMDFGLAKERRVGAELEKLTATGIVLGTPEFMSPEQLRGRPLDGRTDVYALALLAYEMLTGKLPFPGRTQQETMLARLKGAPIPLRDMRPDLGYPEALERALLRGMAREVDDRPATAPEFALAFADGASGRGEGSAGGGLLGRLLGG